MEVTLWQNIMIQFLCFICYKQHVQRYAWEKWSHSGYYCESCKHPKFLLLLEGYVYALYCVFASKVYWIYTMNNKFILQLIYQLGMIKCLCLWSLPNELLCDDKLIIMDIKGDIIFCGARIHCISFCREAVHDIYRQW